MLLGIQLLVLISSIITFQINKDTYEIALGSMFGFIAAQIMAGIFYQLTIKKSFFIKVNGSDAIGIVIDSIVFQLVAFNQINYIITFSQIGLKLIGGLFWYWLIFKKLELHKKWINT